MVEKGLVHQPGMCLSSCYKSVSTLAVPGFSERRLLLKHPGSMSDGCQLPIRWEDGDGLGAMAFLLAQLGLQNLHSCILTIDLWVSVVINGQTTSPVPRYSSHAKAEVGQMAFWKGLLLFF